MSNVKLISCTLVLAVLILSCTSCTSDSNIHSEKAGKVASNTADKLRKNLNISVFIDLSDRINPEKYPMPSMEIYQRDLGYIKSISNAFEDHVRNSKIRQVEDYMQIFFEPEPMNAEINTLSNTMKLSFDKGSVSKESIARIEPTYTEGSAKIYQLALRDQRFIGSDIWSFFKTKLKDYCIKPNHRNVLVILTDGYIYHKDNLLTDGNRSTFLTPELISGWRLNSPHFASLIEDQKLGFIPATDGLKDLEVLVLGINPVKGKNYEEDVIKRYWEEWLTQMGVEKFYLKGADLPSNLDPVIREIIGG